MAAQRNNCQDLCQEIHHRPSRYHLNVASQRSEKSLMLSMKLASTRTLRARRSGTGPGRWVDLAYLKRSSTLRVTSGSAGRSSEAIFRHFWFPKTKRTLHKGRVRLPKRTRRRSCRDSDRPNPQICFFVFLERWSPATRRRGREFLEFLSFFQFFRVFAMGVGFGQGSVPLRRPGGKRCARPGGCSYAYGCGKGGKGVHGSPSSARFTHFTLP